MLESILKELEKQDNWQKKLLQNLTELLDAINKNSQRISKLEQSFSDLILTIKEQNLILENIIKEQSKLKNLLMNMNLEEKSLTESLKILAEQLNTLNSIYLKDKKKLINLQKIYNETEEILKELKRE